MNAVEALAEGMDEKTQTLRVPMGDDALMALPTQTACWAARYAPDNLNRFTAAENFDSYRYLVMECTKEEAWRRIKLMRAASLAEGAET